MLKKLQMPFSAYFLRPFTEQIHQKQCASENLFLFNGTFYDANTETHNLMFMKTKKLATHRHAKTLLLSGTEG